MPLARRGAGPRRPCGRRRSSRSSGSFRWTCAASPPRWNDTRVLIFTEYEDTQRYLSRRLEAALEGTDRADQRIAVYSGPTSAEQREEIKRAFNGDPAKHPLRILIATDAAREGINLQTQCWNLFHFDVPWNPGRMEQRNGRIDRKLQQRDEVYCHYFVYPQRAEDRVLKVLVRKTETIKRELGSLSQVVEEKFAVVLGHGIRHADAAHLEAEARAAVEEELEAARERRDALKAQVDRLRTHIEDSREWVGFDEGHFGAALGPPPHLLDRAGHRLPQQRVEGAHRRRLARRPAQARGRLHQERR